MRRAVAAALVAGLSVSGTLAAAPDAGPDAGADGGAVCAFGEADCASAPWMWCDSNGDWIATDCFGSEEAPLAYSPCNCAIEDPCGWAGDTICDDACLLVIDEMFDDSADCAPVLDAGADADADADTDADSDTDTSTDTGADASAGGGDDTGCSCSAAGRPTPGSLLLRLF
jgi:hypothetical protein